MAVTEAGSASASEAVSSVIHGIEDFLRYFAPGFVALASWWLADPQQQSLRPSWRLSGRHTRRAKTPPKPLRANSAPKSLLKSISYGGPPGSRTRDPLLKRQVL